ncbi:Ribosomal lysine N-methyltransferase 4 [Abortiporus biennis]
MEKFTSWFRFQNGFFDSEVMGLCDIPGHGRGAYALKDIPEGYPLFSLPRNLTLSMRTSSLPEKFGREVWTEKGLNTGWVGLILCMMYEESLGESSKWSGYLDVLPSTFDTPMFWSEEDIKELQGTAVVDKIGRGEAEKDYNEKLIPAIQSRPDLFPPEVIPRFYSLERYHIMGSRILSRSFHVSEWKPSDHDEEDEDEADENDHHDGEEGEGYVEANTSLGSAMDVDEPEIRTEGDEDDSDSDDEDVEDPSDVAMVPMADMLNARFESENAKLFYEPTELKMITTRPIKAGEQIWNTYGDPPNSDLLRRYGHVDVVPFPPTFNSPICIKTPGIEGNPADVVEIRADLVVESVKKKKLASMNGGNKGGKDDEMKERVDWWLEFADDDVFVLSTDCTVPEDLISLARLLLLSSSDWKRAKEKSKLPKPAMDEETLPIVIDVFERRLKEYLTTLNYDEAALKDSSALSTNKRSAIVVRIGEKRILDGTLQELKDLKKKLAKEKRDGNRKRKVEDTDSGRNKKSRR